MEFNVSEGAAWAVLFSVLSVFTIIAFIASGWFGSPPILEKLGCILLPKFGNDSNDTTVSGRQLQRSESVKQSGTADHFLSELCGYPCNRSIVLRLWNGSGEKRLHVCNGVHYIISLLMLCVPRLSLHVVGCLRFYRDGCQSCSFMDRCIGVCRRFKFTSIGKYTVFINHCSHII